MPHACAPDLSQSPSPVPTGADDETRATYQPARLQAEPIQASIIMLRIDSVHGHHDHQHQREQQQVYPGVNAVGNTPDPSRSQADTEP